MTMLQARRIAHLFKRKEDGGQAILELAFGLPVFFLMVFGFIQFSLILFGMCNANFASRAAMRYASLHSLTSYKPTAQSDLNTIMSAFILPYPTNTWTVSASYATGNGGANQAGNYIGNGIYVTVSGSYPIKVMGHTFKTVTYSTQACGVVMQ